MKRTFTILLSASVPSRERSEVYRKIPHAQLQIEEAVIGLARNVFQANGQLVFGGHPSISPLVAMVAMEYDIDRETERPVGETEKPVVIFQSEAFRDVLPDETLDLFSLGHVEVVWTEAWHGEKYNPDIKGIPQCKKSLRIMREAMVSKKIDALVCIGGMEGVEEEFKLFIESHPEKPVYLLESTGGAAGRIADRYPELEYIFEGREVLPDLSRIQIVERLHLPSTEQRVVPEMEEIVKIVPYTLLTSFIVDDLLPKA